MHKSQQTTIAILGATGGMGLQIVRQALSAGHRVQALVRDRARLLAALPQALARDPRLHVMEGSATDLKAVGRVVRGATAVLCALGAPARSRSRVRSEGTATIIQAMKAEGIDRLIAVSVYGALETRKHLPFFLKYLIFPLYLSRVVTDHERQEQLLQGSGLRWTAVRPPNLNDDEVSADLMHGIGEIDGLDMQVSRAAVAGFMLAQVACDDYIGQAPTVGVAKEPAGGSVVAHAG